MRVGAAIYLPPNSFLAGKVATSLLPALSMDVASCSLRISTNLYDRL